MRRNKHKQNNEVSRRDFMWKTGCASMGVVSMATTIWDLRFMNAALATTSGPINDYKALVCVFLNGGNDANNMLIPSDTTTYNYYVGQRGGAFDPSSNTTSIAISPAGTTGTTGANIGLLPINPLTSDGHTYGLHPAMPELQTLFNGGHMAILANVGTMVYPFPYGADSYFGRNSRPKVPQPYQLFSHNDQQIQWQTSVSDTATGTGWGGRAADMINAAANPAANVSMAISLGGQNTFEVGTNVSEYSISTSGAPAPVSNYGSGASSQLQALNDLIGYRGTNVASIQDPGYSATYDITTIHPNLYEQSYSMYTRNGIQNATVVNSVYGGTNIQNTDVAFTVWNSATTATPAGYGSSSSLSGFAQQLRAVVKMIAGRTTLGHKRQIFFVQVGGYDLHTTQGGAVGSHANLLRDLSKGLNGFYDALTRINNPDGGTYATQVTAFTVSDFSRTFPMNGGFGTDHGWGNHQLIVGGAVQGQKIYGSVTNFVVGGTQDTGTGRWIPTTSCDEYFACLARWYGVSTTDIAATVLPNIGHFANNLNFV